jgi:hypothetical protein
MSELLGRARRLLDDVQHLAQVEAFDAAPFAAAVASAAAAAVTSEAAVASDAAAGGVLAIVGARLDELRALLDEIDRFAQKSMRIRITYACDALPPQFRTLLFSTIVSYERDPPLLRTRVSASLARIDPATAGATTDAIMRAAEQTLAMRATLREAVLGAARAFAGAQVAAVAQAARDASLAEKDRVALRCARVDLAQVVERPELIAAAPFAARLAKIDPPGDEPEPEPATSRTSLLEID